MDNLDDSENNAKISDSAYSNSCSNSQSRRSHSSKSTHSGSHSSGSSGYGGKPPSGCSDNLGQPQKKEKDSKKKKQTPVVTFTTEKQVEAECMPPEPIPVDVLVPPKEINDVVQTPSPTETDTGQEDMDISPPVRSPKEEFYFQVPSVQQPSTSMYVGNLPTTPAKTDGFSCVISMQDGVVMYTTSSLTTTLGFPKDMWIGRSFINFVHPRDRNTFASQITNGLALPKIENGTQTKALSPSNSESTMVCRIREYRGLSTSFGVKDMKVNYMPFLLKLTFKNISDEDGKVIYLVIQATPFFSAFKIPNEIIIRPSPFVIRHAANGNLEYIDSESVPYLGYLPQDLIDKDALKLYHPDDLVYLRHVYETIVKEGGLPRSKAYRMLTQNCDFIKVETEWSSFINPWSRKLEFVIGKHHIIEGPSDPDVFQNSIPEKAAKFTEEELNKAQSLRDNIVRVMNEVLTKPAEVAKQQMSKRCQDLATFMESLMEEPTKTEDELRLEIQDPDHSYYEPDSVMLGGISPHHEYSDSKSSTETPLSYTQLNYNETLHRYFDNHQPYSDDEYKTAAGENILGLQGSKAVVRNCLSPMGVTSAVSGNMTSSSDSNIALTEDTQVGPIGDYPPVRLTESLLAKHNSAMEKKLMRSHRECRPSGKGEREKVTHETRQKKKEHLARCNASFQPTTSHAPDPQFVQPHGVKRSSRQETEAGAHKHHCPNSRNNRRKQVTSTITSQPSPSNTANANNHPWSTNQVNNMNTFVLGLGIPPHQMSLMSPMPAMPGMFPMYYSPSSRPPGPNFQEAHSSRRSNNQRHQHQMPQMPCMMYGQPMYGQPFMYSPVGPQVPYPMPHHSVMGQNFQPPMTPLELTRSNYEEACKVTIPTKSTKTVNAWLNKKLEGSHAASNTNQGSGESGTSTNALNRSTEAVTDTNPSSDDKSKTDRLGNSEEQVDRTDAESSYSSFYSSFFRTESGSAEESSDTKKADNKQPNKNRLRYWDKNRGAGSTSSRSRYNSTMPHTNHASRQTRGGRKMQPPWMEQVAMTSDLMNKYQVLTKNLEEVLAADQQKLSSLPQPNLVNEQLDQLYLDLQLQGEAAKLTLEEGITSSSSSGEETNANATNASRKKRDFNKLVMIYEEDAPMPPPSDTN